MRTARARTTVAAVVAVGFALLVASIILVNNLEQRMTENLAEAARLHASEITVELAEGSSPQGLVLSDDDDVVVQILDARNHLIASTPRIATAEPITFVVEGRSQIVEGEQVRDDDPFIFVSDATSTPAGGMTVLVGRNLDLALEAASTAKRSLAGGIPLLLVLVASVTWRVVGQSLAPVEAMRREVAEISLGDLERRVPVPDRKDEIGRLAYTLNEMLNRLERAVEQQRRLVADASHELRNPIAAIRHHAEIALSHPETTTVGTLAEDVLTEDLRLQQLSEDLLLLARADEHTLMTKPQPLDLDDLVLEVAARMREITALRIDTTNVSAGRIRGDKDQLRRAIQNLGDNAARHAASTIRFALHDRDGHVVLHVDDDGGGIPPDARAQVFERFARLDTARDRGHGGAGLGLAIVAEVVAAHGGTAIVHDAPIGGARIEVRMPSHRS